MVATCGSTDGTAKGRMATTEQPYILVNIGLRFIARDA